MTENTFSFAAITWGIVTGERRGMNEPIVNWGLLGVRDGYTCSLRNKVHDVNSLLVKYSFYSLFIHL